MAEPFTITPEIRALWEAYAMLKQEAEDSLLVRDGVAAARAFYDFVEAFMPARYGDNVMPLSLYRQRQRELRGWRL